MGYPGNMEKGISAEGSRDLDFHSLIWHEQHNATTFMTIYTYFVCSVILFTTLLVKYMCVSLT